MKSRFNASLLVLFLIAQSVCAQADGVAGAVRFSFGHDRPGFVPVAGTNLISNAGDFGFEPGAMVSAGDDCLTADNPFLFSVKLPEGNYAVRVGFRGLDKNSDVTVKAEMRRLMLENISVAPGETLSRAFIVNVRTPTISGGDRVRLKKRELETEMVAWDEKLTLEFNGTRPSVGWLEIVSTNVPTVFLAGDSTVCDQPSEPWNSWGQMLTRFFKPDIAVANYANSGESIKSSLGARRFEKVFSLMKPGDWLLVQFGHNDMKDKATNALEVYEANLRSIVARTREKGGTPVLITSMERKAGIEKPTLAGYPDTVRKVAAEEKASLIDLNSMSIVFYRALGTNLSLAFQDGTHHNNYGSYQLARCVVEGIRKNVPALARHLADDAGVFDPAKPDDPLTFNIPASPSHSSSKPEGN
ncbi:MAG TPA: rhamnogalacturonan acetylesterase [Verrucomicrobiota bacterium]|nr:rhamnogalacturonan acetylesterase [Verrucomicrobiota bacterium]